MKNKLLLPIAAGLGIALFSRKTNSTSKKSTMDKGFIFKCNPVDFYITDKNKANQYFITTAQKLFPKYSDFQNIDYSLYFKDFLLQAAPACYKLYVTGKMTKEELMAVAIIFFRAFRAYLEIVFSPIYVKAYFGSGIEEQFTEEEKADYEIFVKYFEDYAQPRWIKIADSFNFTEEELKKIDEIEQQGILE